MGTFIPKGQGAIAESLSTTRKGNSKSSVWPNRTLYWVTHSLSRSDYTLVCNYFPQWRNSPGLKHLETMKAWDICMGLQKAKKHFVWSWKEDVPDEPDETTPLLGSDSSRKDHKAAQLQQTSEGSVRHYCKKYFKNMLDYVTKCSKWPGWDPADGYAATIAPRIAFATLCCNCHTAGFALAGVSAGYAVAAGARRTWKACAERREQREKDESQERHVELQSTPKIAMNPPQ